jgi:hypothetical protein
VGRTRAEQICAEANEARLELSDYRSIVDGDDAQIVALVRERADIVDRATDIMEQMLDDVVAVEPLDEKGRAIVPQWEAEYRSYLEVGAPTPTTCGRRARTSRSTNPAPTASRSASASRPSRATTRCRRAPRRATSPADVDRRHGAPDHPGRAPTAIE